MNAPLLSIVWATLAPHHTSENFLDPREKKIIETFREVVLADSQKKLSLTTFSKAISLQKKLRDKGRARVTLDCLLTKIHSITTNWMRCKCRNNTLLSPNPVGCYKNRLSNFLVLKSLESIDSDLYGKIRNKLNYYIDIQYRGQQKKPCRRYMHAFLDQKLDCQSYVKSYEKIVSTMEDNPINSNLGFIEKAQQDEEPENLISSSAISESEEEENSPQKEIDLDNQIPWEGNPNFLIE